MAGTEIQSLSKHGLRKSLSWLREEEGRGQGQGPPRTTSKRVGVALWFARAGPAPQKCPHPHLPPAACPLTLPLPSSSSLRSSEPLLAKHSFPLHGPIPSKFRAGEPGCGGRPPLHLRTRRRGQWEGDPPSIRHLTGPGPGPFLRGPPSPANRLPAICTWRPCVLNSPWACGLVSERLTSLLEVTQLLQKRTEMDSSPVL